MRDEVHARSEGSFKEKRKKEDQKLSLYRLKLPHVL
jgi:hypothetical protein